MPEVEFDVERSWRLGEQVAVRREPFGALIYHFGTRRLSFLKSAQLREVVQALENHASAREACLAAGVPEPELPQYERALSTLASSGMIVEHNHPR